MVSLLVALDPSSSAPRRGGDSTRCRAVVRRRLRVFPVRGSRAHRLGVAAFPSADRAGTTRSGDRSGVRPGAARARKAGLLGDEARPNCQRQRGSRGLGERRVARLAYRVRLALDAPIRPPRLTPRQAERSSRRETEGAGDVPSGDTGATGVCGRLASNHEPSPDSLHPQSPFPVKRTKVGTWDPEWMPRSAFSLFY